MMRRPSLFFKPFSALAEQKIAGAAIISIAICLSGLASQAFCPDPCGDAQRGRAEYQ